MHGLTHDTHFTTHTHDTHFTTHTQYKHDAMHTLSGAVGLLALSIIMMLNMIFQNHYQNMPDIFVGALKGAESDGDA